jgi:hypothetical protein
MKSDQNLSSRKHRFVTLLGLVGTAAVLPASAGEAANDTYTWSAELIQVDEPAHTIQVQSRLVANAEVHFDALDRGDRVTLTWSGINVAAGVRSIVDGEAPDDHLMTLPIELVSAEHDGQYVSFKVAVPAVDLAKVASLQPGSWITATSPRRAARFEEAVADLRPYNDVG